MARHRIPELARTLDDRGSLQNPPRAIVWSCDEFRAASHAFAELLEPPEDRGPAAAEIDPDGTDLLLAAGVPEPTRSLMLWFDERYRAHHARVALLHFDRFTAIMAFLHEHGERLKREGLFEEDESGMWLDEDLLRALVSVDYRPSLAPDSENTGILHCGDILALAAALQSGAVQVVEFTRVPPTGEDPGPEPDEGPDAFELHDFEDAMKVWFELNQRPDAELRAEARRFRQNLDPGMEEKLRGAPEVVLLLEWFADRFGAAPGVGAFIQRFMLMAGFIEEYLDRLVDLELLEPNGERYRVSGALFSTLNNLPLAPSRRGGVEPFDFETVVAVAGAHRELFGADAIVKRETLTSRWGHAAPA